MPFAQPNYIEQYDASKPPSLKELTARMKGLTSADARKAARVWFDARMRLHERHKEFAGEAWEDSPLFKLCVVCGKQISPMKMGKIPHAVTCTEPCQKKHRASNSAKRSKVYKRKPARKVAA